MRQHWRLGLGLLAAAAYAFASHFLMVYVADKPWAVAALLGPLLLACLAVALRQRHLPGLTAVALATLGIAAVVAHGGVGPVSRLYLAQHMGIHLMLFFSFAITLRPGRLSLIGRLAERLHGHSLTPAMESYTRRVTQVWVAYFLLMALASLWVYAALSWTAWSLLANLVTPVAIAALFVGEYLLRYRLHPEFERSSLADAVRAYRNEPARGVAGR